MKDMVLVEYDGDDMDEGDEIGWDRVEVYIPRTSASGYNECPLWNRYEELTSPGPTCLKSNFEQSHRIDIDLVDKET